MFGATGGLVLTMIAWGAQVPLISLISDRYDPYMLAAIRFAGGAPLLLLVLRLTERGPLFAGLPLRWLAGLGVAVAAFGTLYTAGIANAHPVTAAVLSAMSPATATLVAWAVLGSRPTLLTTVAVVVVALGGVLATVDFDYPETFRLRGGEVLILIGSACWSWYSIEAQRRLPGASQLRITATVMSVAAVFLAIIYVCAGAAHVTRGSLGDATPADLGIFAMMIVGVVVVGSFFWNYGVARLGVVIASMYLNLIPVIALLVSISLGYHVRFEQLLGGGIVLAGVTLAQAGPQILRFRRRQGAES